MRTKRGAPVKPGGTFVATSLGLALLLSACDATLGGGLNEEGGEETGTDVANPEQEPTPGEAAPIPEGDPRDTVGNCERSGPGAAAPRVVRLSALEFRNTVRDLLGDPTLESGSFIQAADHHGYVGTAPELRSVSQLDAYVAEAESLAALASSTLPELADVGSHGDEVFIREFLEEFGRRVHRRRLTMEEVDAYLGIYRLAREGADGTTGLNWMLRALFGSPEFLYLIERVRADQGEGVLPLSGYERAARLSYFLTGSMPDEELLQAAESGALDLADGVQEHAHRLLSSEKGALQIERFLLEWLEVESADPSNVARLQEIDPEFDNLPSSLALSLVAPLRAAQSGVSFPDLLTAKGLYVDAALGPALDAPAPAGEGYALVQAEGRVGLLTHPAVLTLHGTEGFAKSTHRGVFVMHKILCQEPPEPNADIIEQFPVVTEDDWLPTQRETLEELHQVDGCSSCHVLIDGFGYAFEHYDSLGRYRTEEENIPGVIAPVDASGTLFLDGQQHPYEDAAEYLAIMAESPEIQQCMSRQLLRFALHRLDEVQTTDACSLQEMEGAFSAGSTFAEAFLAFTQTDAFLSQSAFESSETQEEM